ncbi:MAG: valine--tRNA ligase [Parcubacteria group bacterium]|jgi:valyl-tRNA synthetase
MQEIPKQFNFQTDEEKIYALWEKSGFFNPDKIRAKQKYCNVLPPPNANGELHLGHASGYTVMDIFGRYERMKGKKVLLLPGKDHAGIPTQVVYEHKIKKERGLTRQDLGREAFFKEVYAFCIDRADYMRAQEKKIGISADWSREKFTLDGDVSKIAMETFVRMYQDGMVYKGKRIINWCPRCGTALSDLEVLHAERDAKFYYIKYPVKNSDEFITVATTRPETMLGDTAVAVNPEDKRYFKYIGRHVILPLKNKELPIIFDKRIDKDFGTGAVKITPAHDPLDWQIGQDHDLESIQVIDEQAEITLAGGKYRGQGVLQARENILNDLKKLGLLEKEEAIKSNISICERCKTTIEPLISEQWFISVDAEKYSLKKEALEAIKSGKINFYPENFQKVMTQWLSGLHDWCISRQTWWGHRFPVWYRGKEIYVGLDAPKGEGWTQDENVFDTWFSSGQWAYSTLGFPKGKDYQNFYPTDMMIMGWDILFFWSARMIMLSLYRTGKIPFKNLYFTGLIRDKEGKKMSKSKGNGIDPLEMIKKYGADAVRLSLVMDVSPGQDSRLYEEKIEGFRNFVTKLWNIYRYALQSSSKFKLVEKISKKDLKSLADKWIVSELEETKAAVSGFMDNREISLSQTRLRRFTWDQLAAWYIETNKIEKNEKVLGHVLHELLKLWHPFMPFVTEKIWGIFEKDKKVLMMAQWPKVEKKMIDAKAAGSFAVLQELIIKIRNIRASYHIDSARKIEAYTKDIAEQGVIEKLSRIKIVIGRSKEKMLRISSKGVKLSLDIAKTIDVKKEREALGKEIKNLENLIAKTEALSQNENFLSKANVDIINATNARLDEYKQKLEIQKELEENLKSLA